MRERLKDDVVQELKAEIKCTCFNVLDKWERQNNPVESLLDTTVRYCMENYLKYKLKKDETLCTLIEFHKKVVSAKDCTDDLYEEWICDEFYDLVDRTIEMKKVK
ncbi:MAG: hypothetical protein K2H01_11070 [Ruminococcus sp.]|nr:hypothetical protein [Ruminococcus sp.]